MNIVEFLLPISLLLGLGFAAAFVYAVRSDQYDDCETPAYRALFDSEPRHSTTQNQTSKRHNGDLT